MHEDSSEPSPTPPLPRQHGGGSRPSLPLALMPTHRGFSTPCGRCSFRPHPEERAPEIVVRTPHARARVSKDGGGTSRGGLLLRDASQSNRARGNRRVRPRCDAPQHEAGRGYGRGSFRPHPEERAPEIVVRTPHTHARASRRMGAARVGAASCFETHRSATVLVETDVCARAAMLLSMRPSPIPYCSNLSMNHLSSRVQISSLPTWSSMPCSRFGLSLTSMTMKPRSVSLMSTP